MTEAASEVDAQRDENSATCRHIAWVYLHPELLQTFAEELAGNPPMRADFLGTFSIEARPRIEAVLQRFDAGDDVKLKFLDLVAQSRESLTLFLASEAASLASVDAAYAAARTDPARKQLVDDKNFGRWLGDMCELIRASGRSRASFLMETQEHVLALRIEWKTDPNGARRIRISAYDPNLTVNHKVFEAVDPVNLHLREMDDCFDTIADYFVSGYSDDRCLTAFGLECSIATPDALEYLDFKDGAYLNPELFREALYHAIADGLPDGVTHLARVLDKTGIRDDEALPFMRMNMALLHAFDDRQGRRTFIPYANALVSLGISGASAIPLMGTLLKSGITGPNQSFVQKDGESMLAYAESLRILGIKRELAAPLMTAVNHDGMSATFNALMTGEADQWMLDYARAHSLVGLTLEAAVPSMRPVLGEQKLKCSAVYEAMKIGNIRSVEAFATALHSIGIFGELAKPLFEVVDRRGIARLVEESDKGVFDEPTEHAYRAAQRKLGILPSIDS